MGDVLGRRVWHAEDRSTLAMFGQEYVSTGSAPSSSARDDHGGLPVDLFEALVAMWEEILLADYRAQGAGPLEPQRLA